MDGGACQRRRRPHFGVAGDECLAAEEASGEHARGASCRQRESPTQSVARGRSACAFTQISLSCAGGIALMIPMVEGQEDVQRIPSSSPEVTRAVRVFP
jgi:hypothetical protein